ncbi:hypothetical protein KW850_30970 [Bacillus sp. sid0103]|nr:hypothetical protein [Bacillus sp. sid0103]
MMLYESHHEAADHVQPQAIKNEASLMLRSKPELGPACRSRSSGAGLRA